jgi:hypothetical protein
MRRNLLNEGKMCMTWEMSDGRKERNVIHLCRGKEKATREEKKNGKIV